MPICHVTLKGQKPLQPAYPKQLKTLGDHLRKRRLDLGLLQKELAQLVDVDESTVTNWELNRCVPDLRKIPAVIRFLAYLPDQGGTSPGQTLRTARRVLGLSIKEVARVVGVDPGTVAKWEKGRRQPSASQSTQLKRILSPSRGE